MEGGQTEETGRERGNGLGPPETSQAETLIVQFDHLDFGIHKSRRYHEKLANFYSGWRDNMRVVAIVSGNGAFGLVLADSALGKYVTGFVALWAVLDIILRPDKKEEIHSDLRKRFTKLAGR